MVGDNTKSYYNEMMSEVPPFLENPPKYGKRCGKWLSLIWIFLGVLGIHLLCFWLEDPSNVDEILDEMAEIRCFF